MSTAAVPLPTGQELAATFSVIGDEDLIHMVRWCDPYTALCGEELLGDEFAEDDADGPRCPECVAVDRSPEERAHDATCPKCRDEVL